MTESLGNWKFQRVRLYDGCAVKICHQIMKIVFYAFERMFDIASRNVFEFQNLPSLLSIEYKKTKTNITNITNITLYVMYVDMKSI